MGCGVMVALEFLALAVIGFESLRPNKPPIHLQARTGWNRERHRNLTSIPVRLQRSRVRIGAKNLEVDCATIFVEHIFSVKCRGSLIGRAPFS